MKVTIENNGKEFILCKIESVHIGFDDNTEVKLSNIVDYDIDLNRGNYSTISFTDVFHNVQIENHFSKNSKIIYIHINGKGLADRDFDNEINVLYDIPCDMKIIRFRTDGNPTECGSMFIELEGIVK